MWKAAYVVPAAVLGAAILGLPRQALALGPLEIEGGGFVGAGSNPSHGPNPLAVGIGARAGVDVRNLYAGLAVTYYFGDAGQCGAGAPANSPGNSPLPAAFCNLGAGGGEVQLNQHASLYGLDLGYTFGFARAKFFKLRPLLELGDLEIARTGTVSSQTLTSGPLAGLRSDNAFYLQPGLTAFLTVDALFLGVDANLLLVPSVVDIDGITPNVAGTGNLASSSRTLAAFTAHAQVGFRF